jgi:hypothetical protein
MMHLPDCSVCVHVPAPSHKSFVHDKASLVQAVVFERLVHADVVVVEAHHWHPFEGLTVAFV